QQKHRLLRCRKILILVYRLYTAVKNFPAALHSAFLLTSPTKLASIILIPLFLFLPSFAHAAGGLTGPDAAKIEEVRKQVEAIVAEADLGNCAAVLSLRYDLEMVEFLSFLEANFENKSSNSSLKNIAIARY